MRFYKVYLLLLAAMIVTCVGPDKMAVVPDIGAIEDGLLPSIQVKGDSSITYNIQDRMDHYKVPGVSIAIVQDGIIKWAKGYGIANTNTGRKVDTATIFQAGSISKPLAAIAALQLVENGNLDLDNDINTYLTDWKVPENEFTIIEKVTLRRLLTHSAGMTVHGFPGYKQSDSFPSITQVLNGEGNTAKILVDTLPGSIWRYSGGGYTVIEKIIEDLSGESLDDYMAKNVLRPMGMVKSTFQQPLGEQFHLNASAAYDEKGNIIEGLWHNYPEQAAAGLWTTAADLAKYCVEIQEILSGKENGVLKKHTVEQMLTKHKNDWGLGPSLRKEKDSLLFGHGGKNAGFTNNMVAFANKGIAVVVMTNADNGGKLIGEILRAVSDYYDWEISNQRIVETIQVAEDDLQQLTGKYKLNFQVPDIGNYFIDVSVVNGKLTVTDPNNGEVNTLTALKALHFVDLESGDDVVFQNSEEHQGVLFNNRFQFDKTGD